jgi:hypothetical protein
LRQFLHGLLLDRGDAVNVEVSQRILQAGRIQQGAVELVAD